MGIPFVPHGRDPGKGLDCAGLVVHCYAAAGLEIEDQPYSLSGRPDLWSLVVNAFDVPALERVNAPFEPGDILAFRRPANAPYLNNHLAIFDGYRCGVPFMIHAYDHVRKNCVVESPFRAEMIEHAWRIA